MKIVAIILFVLAGLAIAAYTAYPTADEAFPLAHLMVVTVPLVIVVILGWLILNRK